MAYKMEYNKEKGYYQTLVRDDAVRHDGRYYVPTTNQTKWIGSWEEFNAAGGVVSLSEDQAQIELFLPEGYKFSCSFMRPVS